MGMLRQLCEGQLWVAFFSMPLKLGERKMKESLGLCKKIGRYVSWHKTWTFFQTGPSDVTWSEEVSQSRQEGQDGRSRRATKPGHFSTRFFGHIATAAILTGTLCPHGCRWFWHLHGDPLTSAGPRSANNMQSITANFFLLVLAAFLETFNWKHLPTSTTRSWGWPQTLLPKYVTSKEVCVVVIYEAEYLNSAAMPLVSIRYAFLASSIDIYYLIWCLNSIPPISATFFCCKWTPRLVLDSR